MTKMIPYFTLIARKMTCLPQPNTAINNVQCTVRVDMFEKNAL